MRLVADIEADLAIATAPLFDVSHKERNSAHWALTRDIPDLLAALEQARSIAVRLEQEVAANAEPF